MSNIDKHAVQAVADLKAGYRLGHADVAILNELARIALASLEAEAVGEVVLGEYDDCGCHPDAKVVCIAADGQADWENFKDGTRLYTAPPAPVSVPDAIHSQGEKSASDDYYALGWNACRAAMLKRSEPFIVTSDHRMMEMPQVEAINAVTAILQGAEPVNQPCTLPDGYCVMPLKLTSENGAKGALSGEFYVTNRIVCLSCAGEGCEDCNDEGGWDAEIPVSWDTIKRIHEAAVEACALPAAPQQEAE